MTTNSIITKMNNNIQKLIKYKIIKSFNGHIIKSGNYSGIYKNPYWLIYDDEDEKEKEYYLLHIKNDIFTKISKESINEIHNKWNTETKCITWGINKREITRWYHSMPFMPFCTRYFTRIRTPFRDEYKSRIHQQEQRCSL